MLRTTFIIFISTIALSANATDRPLTGNLSVDLLQRTDINDSIRSEVRGPRKSPLVAVLASALVPGAGQAYVGNWLHAAAFFVADVLGIAVAMHYNSRGNDETNAFQNFADENILKSGGYNSRWSVVKYAQWIDDFLGAPKLNDSIRVWINPNVNLKPWERVNWDTMQILETQIGRNPSTGFSHTLPNHGNQQYYEEIG